MYRERTLTRMSLIRDYIRCINGNVSKTSLCTDNLHIMISHDFDISPKRGYFCVSGFLKIPLGTIDETFVINLSDFNNSYDEILRGIIYQAYVIVEDIYQKHKNKNKELLTKKGKT